MYLGIDIGGTSTKFAIVQNKQIIYQQGIATDFKNCSGWSKQVIKTAQIIHQIYPFTQVSLASAGIINEQGLVLAANESAKNYVGTNWKKLFNNAFKKDIFTFACNDAHALAYYQLAKSKENSLCLTLGTGIGLGLVLDQKVHKGSSFLAGQIGSLIWKDKKTLDQLFSATLLQEKINKLTKEKVFFQDLKKWYDQNLDINKLINQYLDDLAHFIVFISVLLEIKQVIVGGGFSYSGDFFLKLLNEKLIKKMPPIWNKSPLVKFAQDKNEANILGLFLT